LRQSRAGSGVQRDSDGPQDGRACSSSLRIVSVLTASRPVTAHSTVALKGPLRIRPGVPRS